MPISMYISLLCMYGFLPFGNRNFFRRDNSQNHSCRRGCTCDLAELPSFFRESATVAVSVQVLLFERTQRHLTVDTANRYHQNFVASFTYRTNTVLQASTTLTNNSNPWSLWESPPTPVFLIVIPDHIQQQHGQTRNQQWWRVLVPWKLRCLFYGGVSWAFNHSRLFSINVSRSSCRDWLGVTKLHVFRLGRLWRNETAKARQECHGNASLASRSGVSSHIRCILSVSSHAVGFSHFFHAFVTTTDSWKTDTPCVKFPTTWVGWSKNE
jgi:hypothetical protein